MASQSNLGIADQNMQLKRRQRSGLPPHLAAVWPIRFPTYSI